MNVLLRQTYKQDGINSVLILPGNKLIVLGTLRGDIILYDIAQADAVQIIESAHKKEVWELAMHTSPQIRGGGKGELLIASASAD